MAIGDKLSLGEYDAIHSPTAHISDIELTDSAGQVLWGEKARLAGAALERARQEAMLDKEAIERGDEPVADLPFFDTDFDER